MDRLDEPCCTSDNFQIYLEGTPRHPWNKSAADIFVENYIMYHNLTPNHDLSVQVAEDFFMALKGLIARYRRTTSLTSPPRSVYLMQLWRTSWKSSVSFNN